MLLEVLEVNVLGIDIGGTSIKVCKMDENGYLTSFQEYPSFAKEGATKLINRVKEIIKAHSDITAIGISTAGQVNRQDGSIIYANENIPGYTGTNLKKIMEEYFQIPVLVENDVNAAALGEMYFGSGKPYKDFLCLTYGTGIGGAMIINGSIYGGTKGIAGEFGHIITHPHGKKCNCGKLGCYEMYASTTALVSQAFKLNSLYDNGRTIFSDYQKGKSSVTQIVESWIFEVAIGLTTLVHIFNPPAIILGGGIMEQEAIIKQVQITLKQLVMHSFSDVTLIPAGLGNKAGAMGAAALHLRNR